MSKKRVDISKDGYLEMMNTILDNITEERDMALDMYRTQSEQIKSLEDFAIAGKEAVNFLKLSSERTNVILNLAKDIRDIAYAGEMKSGASNGNINPGEVNDDMRKNMQKELEEMKKKQKSADDLEDDDDDNDESI